MKKAVAPVLIVFFTAVVLGHGGAHQSLPEPGHSPGSMMYGLEQAYESVSLALTFSQEEKVKKKIGFAEERLSESAHLAQENKTELAFRASNRYLETINEAEQMANRTGNENLTELVDNHRQDNTEILEDLQEILPEEASQGLDTALEKMDRAQREDNRPENSSDQNGREMAGFVATGRAMN
ncbi:MAG: hypothetical protein ACI8Z7_000249 [Candidatus Nanohaloarchaea archaeon]|jgi:hypothetical protein